MPQLSNNQVRSIHTISVYKGVGKTQTDFLNYGRQACCYLQSFQHAHRGVGKTQTDFSELWKTSLLLLTIIPACAQR